jgi:hypothetical protein
VWSKDYNYISQKLINGNFPDPALKERKGLVLGLDSIILSINK